MMPMRPAQATPSPVGLVNDAGKALKEKAGKTPRPPRG
jgi:hypothetical protein